MNGGIMRLEGIRNEEWREKMRRAQRRGEEKRR